MLDDADLTQALANLPGERITPDYIKARIRTAETIRSQESPTTTIVNIVLDNGYAVRGESACVDPANFDEAIGYKLAYEDAFRKLWPLFGFLLAEKRFRPVERQVGAYIVPIGSFGWAIENMQQGRRVARKGWNGKGMWIAISPGNAALPAGNFWSPPNRDYAIEAGGTAPVLPCITMKTAGGEILMGWLASQTDMLAEDWEVVG